MRRGERIRPRARHADKAHPAVEDVEHRRDDQRAEHHADHQGNLLLPRRRADQLAGLEVLQIVVGNGGDAEHDAGDDQRISDQRARGVSARMLPKQADQHQRRPDHREDADARNGRIGRADQPGHIAAHRRDHQPGDEHEHQSACDQQRRRPDQRAARDHIPQQPRDR
ncbi:hypothetical protein D9M73_168330 [compost metagenome]